MASMSTLGTRTRTSMGHGAGLLGVLRGLDTSSGSDTSARRGGGGVGRGQAGHGDAEHGHGGDRHGESCSDQVGHGEPILVVARCCSVSSVALSCQRAQHYHCRGCRRWNSAAGAATYMLWITFASCVIHTLGADMLEAAGALYDNPHMEEHPARLGCRLKAGLRCMPRQSRTWFVVSMKPKT